MKQSFFEIISNKNIAENVFEMVLAGDTSDITASGQFVNIKLEGKYLRRPISICDYSEKDMSLKIYSILTDRFKEKPGSVANYIDAPKENGYQSFHVKLLSEQGIWEEVHISSERMVRNSRLGCAAECTEENVAAWLEKFKYVLQDVADDSHDMEFMDGVTSSFYNDDIMVFTPKGRGVILPKGATALDFAFEIHSKVGEQAVYARINGKLESLRTVLHRGDCVEIGTAEDAKPELEWMEHVSTYRAKRYLRGYFANQPRLEYERCNHCNPLPGDEVVGFKDQLQAVISFFQVTAVMEKVEFSDFPFLFCRYNFFLIHIHNGFGFIKFSLCLIKFFLLK